MIPAHAVPWPTTSFGCVGTTCQSSPDPLDRDALARAVRRRPGGRARPRSRRSRRARPAPTRRRTPTPRSTRPHGPPRRNRSRFASANGSLHAGSGRGSPPERRVGVGAGRHRRASASRISITRPTWSGAAVRGHGRPRRRGSTGARPPRRRAAGRARETASSSSSSAAPSASAPDPRPASAWRRSPAVSRSTRLARIATAAWRANTEARSRSRSWFEALAAAVEDLEHADRSPTRRGAARRGSTRGT